jgi:hypothetical protein
MAIRTTRIIIGTRNRILYDLLRKMLTQRGFDASTIEMETAMAGVYGALPRKPDVIVFDTRTLSGYPANPTPDLVQYFLNSLAPTAGLIFLGERQHRNLPAASNVLVIEEEIGDSPLPEQVANLARAIEQITTAPRQPSERARSAVSSTPPPTTIAPPSPTPRLNGVFLLWGPSDGLGRRTIGLNLASCLAIFGRQTVCYVDMRRPTCGLNSIFPNGITKNLYQLVSRMNIGSAANLSASTLMTQFQLHDQEIQQNIISISTQSDSPPWRIHYLLGPPNDRQAYDPSFDANVSILGGLLVFLRSRYSYVIVDSPVSPADIIFPTILPHIDRIIVVTNQYRRYIQQTQAMLRGIVHRRSVLNPDTSDIIINRYSGEHGLPIAYLQKELSEVSNNIFALPDGTAELLMEDEICAKSNNRMVPGLLIYHFHRRRLPIQSETPFIREFKIFVNHYLPVFDLNGNPELEKTSSGLLTKIFKR